MRRSEADIRTRSGRRLAGLGVCLLAAALATPVSAQARNGQGRNAPAQGAVRATPAASTAPGPEAYAPFTPEWARAMELQDLAAHRAEQQRRREVEATARLNAAPTSSAPIAYVASGAAAYVPVAEPAVSWTQQPYAAAEPGAGFGPAVEFSDDLRPVERLDARRTGAVAAVERRDIWREGDGHTDRLRLTTRGDLRRADGAPVPPSALNPAGIDVDSYDVSYTRGWEAARAYTPSGLAVTLTPHAGIGMGDSGGTAEAGATLRIGSGLDNVAPRGSERFGERARWYVYAAGSGRAVGYNFARTRDGDFARSGMSHDTGAFLGDASVGVAYRKGDMQGSFGVVYREIEAEGLRGGEGFDRDVSEGLIAFQFSIKPDR